jgi:hypothetical protein
MAGTSAGAQKTAAKLAGISLEQYRSNLAAGLRRCTHCKTWKPVSDYCKDRSRHDGLARTCGTCRRVKVRVCTKGRPSAFKGRTHTTEARAKISAANKGKRPRLGIKHTPETIEKMRAAVAARGGNFGPSNPRWKTDRSAISDRLSPEYHTWRLAVYERDNYTCQECGDNRGGNLCAHHIKSFADHKELRFDIGNGITLCHLCHELRHFKPESIRNRRKKKRGELLWLDKLRAKNKGDVWPVPQI